jgi:hypothetical protein
MMQPQANGTKHRSQSIRRGLPIRIERAAGRNNEPIPHEEVLTEFGLSMADWEKMGKEPSPKELAADERR